MPESNLPHNVTRLRPAADDAGAGDRWRHPSPAHHDPPPASDPDKEAKRTEKRQRELSEPVEPWERYRALRQTLDEAQKFEDVADHKARFAMILMGGLNALLFFGVLSGGLGATALARPLLAAYLALCGLAVVYLFHQAIEALRPRGLGGRARVDRNRPHASRGLRHHDDVLCRSQEAYLAAWREVRVEELNDEMALQVHKQAEVNRVKEAALTRLYAGLRVMMLLLVGLVVIALATGLPRKTSPRDSGSGVKEGEVGKPPAPTPRLSLGSLLGT